MNNEELKLLDELKEHCLKQAMYQDPEAMKKYKMFEMMELKIYELEKEIKHLKDLQSNMDNQYLELEDRNNKALKKIEDFRFEIEGSDYREIKAILEGVEND